MLQEVTSFDPALGWLSSQAPSQSKPGADTGTLSILRVGKLVTKDRETLCRFLRISAGEIVADVGSPHSVGDAISVELNADRQVAGRVIWRRGPTIGIRFDADVDIGAVLANRRSQQSSGTRAPRVPAVCFARLRIEATYLKVPVRDISQGGIKIEIDGRGCVGKDAVVSLDGLAPIKGVVRWARERRAGISFNDRVPFHALVEWLESQAQLERTESTEVRLRAA